MGKTYCMGWVHEEIWKHPHVRGEDGLVTALAGLLSRNTPTCVGKTVGESR